MTTNPPNSALPVPRTILEVMELVAELRSRKAVYQVAIAHLRTCYRDGDVPAEMRMSREGDGGIVPQLHIEKALIEMEGRIDLLDAEIEELQNQPVGGGAPPAADQPALAAAAKAAEDEDIANTARASKKGTSSGKPRPQGSRPS